MMSIIDISKKARLTEEVNLFIEKINVWLSNIRVLISLGYKILFNTISRF